MFWVPVVFFCVAQDSCAFVHDSGQHTKPMCDRIVSEALKVIKNDNRIKFASGTCLKIEPPTV